MKKETFEEAAERLTENAYQNDIWEEGRLKRQGYYQGVVDGAKWQAERMYSYDELRQIAYNAYCKGQLDNPTEGVFNLWIQQFKKI